MGRQNTSSYDDQFMKKTKAIVCQVLDKLNQHQEIEYVQALSGRETVERWNDESALTLDDRSTLSKTQWPVTFEQFVEHLDGQDEFVKNLTELLVSETLRKAIQESLHCLSHTKIDRDLTSPILLSDLGLQRECRDSGRIRTGVQQLTRANRRKGTWYDDDSSSSSSESETTLDPLDILPLNVVPPSTLQDRQGETTRSTRLNREGGIRRSMMAERARLVRQRHEQLQESRQSRASRRGRVREEMERLRGTIESLREESERFRRLTRPQTEAEAPRQTTTSIGEMFSSQPAPTTDTLVHRFLTQPFPSDGRSLSTRRDTSTALPMNASEMAMLTSIYGEASALVDEESPSSHVNPVAITLDNEQRDRATLRRTIGTRLGEFEAFASTRRQSRRTRGASAGQQDQDRSHQLATSASTDEDPNVSRENETFYRALDTLFRADETIRIVSQEAQEADSTSNTMSARRYELPALHEGRPVLRLPSRLSARRDAPSSADIV